jgi:putative tryptophan/tyrosine transport system substrate-binding protein
MAARGTRARGEGAEGRTVAGAQRSAPHWVAFEHRMAQLGYQQSENFTFEFVQASTIEEFELGYHQLATRNVDILVALGPEIAVKSALATTRTLPIVMVAVDYDPLARGYVTSLARPTGNVTGLSFQQIEVAAKRVQIIKDAFPSLKGATVFWDAGSADQWQATQDAAARLGLRFSGIELRDPPYDYERALAQALPDHRAVLIVPTSPFFFRDRARLAEFALRHQMKSVFVFREWVEAGGLLSYGPSITGLLRRAAEYVDRIAKGAKPGDLPIEQPTTFELTINLKTAKALGLTIPTTLLARADEVIE